MPMTWWVQDFVELWICTEEFFGGGGLGCFSCPPFFLPRSSEMGKRTVKNIKILS